MTADSQPCVIQVEGRHRGGDGDSRAEIYMILRRNIVTSCHCCLAANVCDCEEEACPAACL